MSIYLAFKSLRNYPGTEFSGAVSKVGQKRFKFTAVCVFTFSVTFDYYLRNGCFIEFHVTDLPRTGKKCKEAREGSA